MPVISASRIDLAGLIARARAAHAAVTGEPRAALLRAFEAGDALLAIKAQVPHGAWATALRKTGIPPSTARLYMQLARERARIEAAGCTSIREARRLLSGTRPRPTRAPRSGRRGRAEGPDVEARVQAAYAAGFAAGDAHGFARGDAHGYARGLGDAFLGRAKPAPDGGPLDRNDLRWIIKFVHPDQHKGDRRATKVTQWLMTLLGKAPREKARGHTTT
jgi:hypothetical protein